MQQYTAQRRHNYYLSKQEFRKRFAKSGVFAFAIFFVSLLTGVMGYHYIVDLSLIDAFLNASMILGGMGVVSELKTDGQKIFAACYALFSGVAFLSSMAIFLSPLIHRFLHKFHMDIKNENYDDLI